METSTEQVQPEAAVEELDVVCFEKETNGCDGCGACDEEVE